MPFVTEHLHHFDGRLPEVAIPVTRHSIQKTRWRGVAEDGVEFAFEVASPLRDGDVVSCDETKIYRLRQLPETVLRISWPSREVTDAARLAWELGNLHQPIEVREDGICVGDDPAVRAKLGKLECPFEMIETVFRPGGASSGHHHHHHHDHAH